MGEITVYHGGIEIVERPVCAYGRDNLDFGKGFYLTDIRNQAREWALRMSALDAQNHPIVNIYNLDKGGFMNEGRCLVFEEYDEAWLRFIIANRTGKALWRDYDYIEGGIANDRVIDTVNLYINGLMDLEMALGRLSMHRPNNQVCLLNQQLTDKYLIYKGYEYV